MKKIIAVAFLVLLIALCAGNCAFAEDVSTRDKLAIAYENAAESNKEIETFVQQLCELNAYGNKADVRNYITAKFSEALESSSTSGNVEQVMFSYYETNYFNIVARLAKSGASKQVIIGAHYDVSGGDGAADNVTGVAALYSAMKKLAANADKLPFNVTFVAFDGEEDGLLGSQYYVSKMTSNEQLNTLVMFNIDSIALGDNVYLLCENKHTDLADTILANSHDIVEKPYAKGTYGSYLDSIYGFGYGYYEYIQGSDHTPFRLSGIPVAFLFSGTFSNKAWGFSESSNSKQVTNTADDTYENLSQYNFVGRIEQVSDAIADTILSDGFVTVAENAKNQLVNLDLWYNDWWPSIVVAVILVALAVIAFLYNRKLQKKAILGTAQVKGQKVFDKPDANDIFSFDQQQGQKQQQDDIDDIFTFRK